MNENEVEAVIAKWCELRNGPKLRGDEEMARAAIAALDAARGDGPQCSPAKTMLYADRLQGELNNVISALKIVQDDVSRLRRAAEVRVPTEDQK